MNPNMPEGGDIKRVGRHSMPRGTGIRRVGRHNVLGLIDIRRDSVSARSLGSLLSWSDH